MPDPVARPRPVTDLHAALGNALLRMLALQMQAYPAHWSEADRREMAMRDLGLGDERNG